MLGQTRPERVQVLQVLGKSSFARRTMEKVHPRLRHWNYGWKSSLERRNMDGKNMDFNRGEVIPFFRQ
jgi:hypothetical protein